MNDTHGTPPPPPEPPDQVTPGDPGDPGDPGQAGDRRGRRSSPLTPTVVLLLVAGIILLVIGLWAGGNEKATPSVAAAPAQLTILAPADSAELPAPLELTFETSAALHLTPMGWQAGGLHLHALVDGKDVMPGALDVHSMGDNQYRWRLKDVEPGPHSIRLVWARADHRSIPEGASPEVAVEVLR